MRRGKTVKGKQTWHEGRGLNQSFLEMVDKNHINMYILKKGQSISESEPFWIRKCERIMKWTHGDTVTCPICKISEIPKDDSFIVHYIKCERKRKHMKKINAAKRALKKIRVFVDAMSQLKASHIDGPGAYCLREVESEPTVTDTTMRDTFSSSGIDIHTTQKPHIHTCGVFEDVGDRRPRETLHEHTTPHGDKYIVSAKHPFFMNWEFPYIFTNGRGTIRDYTNAKLCDFICSLMRGADDKIPQFQEFMLTYGMLIEQTSLYLPIYQSGNRRDVVNRTETGNSAQTWKKRTRAANAICYKKGLPQYFWTFCISHIHW